MGSTSGLRDAPWDQANPDRVQLLCLARAVYGHPDIQVAHEFLTNFGLHEVERTENPASISYVGYDTQPVSYIAQQTERPQLIAYYFEAASEEDLVKASKIPGAGPITELQTLGGGKAVTLTEPSGLPFGVLYGVKKTPYKAPPGELLPLNFPQASDASVSSVEKPRQGKFQRLMPGAIPVYKLGHCGYWVKDIEATARFFTTHFNFKPSDIMLDPTDNPGTIFFHIDLGKQYSDHHSFIVSQAGGPMPVGPHHASFEVESPDHQFIAHEFLASKGYTSFWGVGRHIEGSQVFDYWIDTHGFLLEHYADGDVVNEDNPINWVSARGKNNNWGPELPSLGPPPEAKGEKA